MSTKLLNYHKLKSKVAPNKQVIILHGYGSNGKNILTIAEEIQNYIPNVDFIAPDAPNRFEGDNIDGYQWFSLINRDPISMLRGVTSATAVITNFMDNIVNPNLPLYIMGFSQGAMLAAHAAMRYKTHNVMGLIMCSGALIASHHLKNELSENARDCTIVITHGDNDNIVDYHLSEEAHNTFLDLGLNSKLIIERNIDHTVGHIAFDNILKILSL
ncbi:alpha/beta hydrolase [Lyticum sinuosum]|uniref:Alpha/beta hydrolase n=1 Tax=Lyticum sinuosum TaxID=1332059 RepID=A0AAE4VM59_9RICK|nr:hypothetical protein [Lyticum sinuosum]MDZ5761323.1 Alpha/beta hydrolase [Lyticum sinuosum]